MKKAQIRLLSKLIVLKHPRENSHIKINIYRIGDSSRIPSALQKASHIHANVITNAHITKMVETEEETAREKAVERELYFWQTKASFELILSFFKRSLPRKKAIKI